MKKISKTIALILAFVMSGVVTTSAQSVILSGTTDKDAKAVTILVVKKGATIENMKGSDIMWIDQQEVGAGGSFSIKLPIYSEEDYDILSNASIMNIDEAKIYVSAAGTGDGTSASNPTTFAGAYEKIDEILEIVITEDVEYQEAPATYYGDLRISGLKGTEKLSLPETVSIKGNLEIDKLVLKNTSKIYANGFELCIGENVTSDSITVLGGKNAESCKSTSLKLLGGTYDYIYGGGYKAAGKVTGSTNIVFGGNATTNYIHGGGLESGAAETYINVSGGVIKEAVYGGISGVNLTADTHITMTGGKTEAIFGGCFNADMNGNSYITVKGGEVTRRIYGGCYNDYGLSGWSGSHSVNGTTNIILYPEAKIATGSDSDKGIYGGSRMKSASANEINTIIFLNGSYSSLSSKLGKSSFINPSGSFHNYIVNSSVGGSVSPVESGEVKVETQNGITALSGGVRYNSGHTITLSAETTITYDGIISADIEETTTTTKANTDVAVSSKAVLLVAIYSEDGSMVSCKKTDVNASKEYIVDVNCKLDVNKKYTAKLFLLSDLITIVPLSTSYTIEVRK